MLNAGKLNLHLLKVLRELFGNMRERDAQVWGFAKPKGEIKCPKRAIFIVL